MSNRTVPHRKRRRRSGIEVLKLPVRIKANGAMRCWKVYAAPIIRRLDGELPADVAPLGIVPRRHIPDRVCRTKVLAGLSCSTR